MASTNPSQGRSDAARLAEKQGMEPGSAVYTGDMSEEGAGRTNLVRYDPTMVDELVLEGPDAPTPHEGAGVCWYDVLGLADWPLIAKFEKAFAIHPLTLEDILNVTTPAKAEEFESHVLVVLPMATLEWEGDLPAIEIEQLSIVAGDGWVVTFQEQPGDTFEPLRERIRSGKGRVRKRGADYLLHAICDSVVDGYFVVLAAFEEQVTLLEEAAVEGAGIDMPKRIHALNARLHAFRRRLWPLQSALNEISRMDAPFLDEKTDPFLRDLQDHARQAIDILDGSRDRLNAVLQLHVALQDHRMNEVMRLLTIVATIFIPLTFVSGIYGMNFQNMPELQWAYGYPVALGTMGGLALAMVAWFRWRRWL